MGVHSGLTEEDVATAPGEGRGAQYGGQALVTAKAVCDCGHGGMVLLSEACRRVLVPVSNLAQHGSILHLGDFAFATAAVEAGDVYLAVAPDMQARVPSLLSAPLRGVTQRQPGAPQAPAQSAAVAFVYVVGAAALSAWDAGVAGRAFTLLHRRARLLMGEVAGRLSVPGSGGGGGDEEDAGGQAGCAYAGVKLVDGLVVVAFSAPLATLQWSLHLVEALRLSDEWEPALLAHELCEEVVVDPGFTGRFSVCGPRSPHPTSGMRSARLSTQFSGELAPESGALGTAPLVPSAALPSLEDGGGAESTRPRSSPTRTAGEPWPRPAPFALPWKKGAHTDSNVKHVCLAMSCEHGHDASPLGPFAAGLLTVGRPEVIFRGLRLKVGVDAGPVQAIIHPSTGRVDYRCVRTWESVWRAVGPQSGADLALECAGRQHRTAPSLLPAVPACDSTTQGPRDEPRRSDRRQSARRPGVGLQLGV